LTRRIRRDLSNKQIRKIVQEQFKESSEHSRRSQKNSFKKPIFYLLGIVVLVALAVFLYRYVDLQSIFSREKTTQIATRETPNNLRKEPTPPAKTTTKPDSSKHRSDKTEPVKQKIQIEVLNGCGVAGIAKITTDFCRKNNLDVVDMDNYVNFAVKHSQVISRNGKKEEALHIARILGINKKYVKVKPDKNKQLAASVVLGKDYKQLKSFKKK